MTKVDAITLAMGGKTRSQKDLERQQAEEKATALAAKIAGLKDDVGSRTRDLVSRYGVNGGSSSPMSG